MQENVLIHDSTYKKKLQITIYNKKTFFRKAFEEHEKVPK